MAHVNCSKGEMGPMYVYIHVFSGQCIQLFMYVYRRFGCYLFGNEHNVVSEVLYSHKNTLSTAQGTLTASVLGHMASCARALMNNT